MAQGPHAEIISAYFLHMKALLVGGFVLGEIDVNSLKKTSAKSLYAGSTSSFPPPKIVYKVAIDWTIVAEIAVTHARAQGQGGDVLADQQHCC